MNGPLRHATGLSALLCTLVAEGGAQSVRLAPKQGIFEAALPLPGMNLPALDGAARFDPASLRGRRVVLLQFASW